ncbi:hypothetical protein OH77DRAFT_1520015 [Trametes cingulata]|nr:hypothetical protein OH77DRAFT_1520015 [Trametes cingulata]
MPHFQRSPLSVPPSLTRAQAALQDQLALLHAQALDISSRLNALSLPARLPPEILCEIFLTHAARVQKEQLDRVLSDLGCVSRVSSYFKWIYVAHVCRHWRAVALACSEFKAFRVFESWTVPEGHLFDNADDHEEGFPLTVVYHQNYEYQCERCISWYASPLDVMDLSMLLPRIRHLVIIIEEDLGTSSLWESLGQACAALETLRIGLRGEAWRYHTAEEGSELIIPNGLFASSTPRLRSLTTSDVSFSWSNSLLCPSLRHLEISQHPGYHRDTDLREFVRTLAALPCLETLVIDCLPAASEPVHSVALLHNLRLLQISTNMGHAASFLPCLRFPSTTSVSLKLGGRKDAPGDLSTLVHALSRIVQEGPLHTMSWTIPPDGLFVDTDQVESCLRAWTGSATAVEKLWVSKPDVAPRLTIMEKDSRRTISLIQALSLPHLRALHLAGPIPSNNQWTYAFTGAPNIAVLRVTGRFGYQLGTSISLGVVPTEGTEGCTTLFAPRLHTLQFSKVRFPPKTRQPTHGGLGLSCCCDDCAATKEYRGRRGLDVKDLVRGIERRRQLGADDIERIEFTDCAHMKMSHMQPLLRGLPVVVIDGVVMEAARMP